MFSYVVKARTFYFVFIPYNKIKLTQILNFAVRNVYLAKETLTLTHGN